MGRRKIEIQPITHERNRSVTFLKRKNGLFKKAYELGVLCSVDVAVIIFEERPGHHVKLYQYCSGNVDDIVQRHSRYDGEKDTRAPHDFINHPNAKHDDVVEGDDDEVEDEDPDIVMANGNGILKRSVDIGATVQPGVKLRQPAMNSNRLPMPNTDYAVHRASTITNSSLSNGNLSLPTSGERLSTPRPLSGGMSNGISNKKPRLAPSMIPDRLPQEEMVSRYGYQSASTPPAYRNPSQFPAYLPGLANPQQTFSSGNSFDLPSKGQFRPMNAPARPMQVYNQRSESQHLMRGQQYQQPQHSHPPVQTLHQQQPPPPHNSGDIFTAFLDGDQKQQGGTGFGPIDWPVHSPAPAGKSEQADPNDASWLDFLSGQSAAGASVEASPLLHGSNRDVLSWQRDHQPAVNGTIALEPASRSPSLIASPKIKSRSNKRPRTDSGVDDRSLSGRPEDEMSIRVSGRNTIKATRCLQGDGSHDHGDLDD